MGKSERKFINTIKINVNDFLIDSPNSSFNDLYKEFGYPEDVISEYYSTINTDTIIKRIKISKYIKILIIILILCLLSLTILRLTILYERHQIFKEEQIQFEESVIE
jgi:hypothetical protein